MKLFSSTQISWNEPWFFLLRIREGWGWGWRVLLAVALSTILFLALYFFPPVQRGMGEMVGISLLAGFTLVLLLDVGNIQREVTVKDDSIIVNSAVGWGWEWFTSFKLDEINAIHLMRPEEWEKAYGGMIIRSPDDNFLVAIPGKISLETLADILHRLQVEVSLSEWEASDSDTRIGVRDEIELDPATASGELTLQPIGSQEGPLMGAGPIAVQVVIALGPLLLALVGAVWVGVVLFRSWSDLTVLEKSGYIAGAVLGVVVGFMYLIKIGQFVAAKYGIGVARKKMQTRTDALFAGTEQDLIGVEIFERKSWTATISQSSDYGFLQIDSGQSQLLFEGNKNRWKMPLSSLTACRIEESIVGSEADANAERRYFVVIETKHQSEPWEAGMVYTRTELGNDTPESRYKRAKSLFMQLAEVVETRR